MREVKRARLMIEQRRGKSTHETRLQRRRLREESILVIIVMMLTDRDRGDDQDPERDRETGQDPETGGLMTRETTPREMIRRRVLRMNLRMVELLQKMFLLNRPQR